MTNAFSSEISGGSFYGKVDNRDRSDFRPMYLGILAGGTFYAGNPGTVANGCCTVTYDYGKVGGTYATQIVQKGEAAIRPADLKLSGFDFSGWLKNGTPYDFDTPVTGDLTLTARWRKIVPGSGTEHAHHHQLHQRRHSDRQRGGRMSSSIPPMGARAASPAPPPLMPVSASAP